MTEEALASHVTLFLLAGFETTSSNMAFAAYFLALNPEYQEKLLQEIDEELEKHVSLRFFFQIISFVFLAEIYIYIYMVFFMVLVYFLGKINV